VIHIVTCELNDLTGLLRTADSLSDISNQINWIIVTNRNDLPDSILGLSPTIVRDQKNGIYAAMNLGIMSIEEASGKVFFLNAGDEIIVENFLLALELTQEEGDIYIFKTLVINIEGEAIRFSSAGSTDIHRMLLGARGFLQQSTIYEKSVFDEQGLFSEKYRIASDLEFYARIQKETRFKYYSLPITKYYLGGASSVHRISTAFELFAIRREYSTEKNVIIAWIHNFAYLVRNLTRAIAVMLFLRIYPKLFIKIQSWTDQKFQEGVE